MELNEITAMIKYEMEFPIRSSISILYNSISTPSGLAEWFCNDVNIKGKVYSFKWEYSDQDAELLRKKANELVKLKWLDVDDEKAYFEMRIQVDEITNDVSLIITDFADDEDDMEEAKLLWDTQIHNLMHSIGS